MASIIFEQMFLFLFSFLVVLFSFFVYIIQYESLVFFNWREYILFVSIMEITLAITMLSILVIAVHAPINMLINTGFKAKKSIQIIKHSIQFGLLINTSIILIMSFSLISDIDKTRSVVQSKENQFYKDHATLISFKLAYHSKATSEEEKQKERDVKFLNHAKDIESFDNFLLENEKHISYHRFQNDGISEEDKSRLSKTQQQDVLLETRYVFANKNFLEHINFKAYDKCKTSHCIFIGTSQMVNKDKILAYINEKNTHVPGAIPRTYDIITYNDTNPISFYQFRASQDFNNQLEKKSPVIFVEEISSMTPKERLSEMTNVRLLYEGTSEKRVNDEFYKALAKQKATPWLDEYENSYQEYLIFNNHNIQVLKQFLMTFLFSMVLFISITSINVITTLKNDKKNGAIKKLLGFSKYNIAQEYIFSILLFIVLSGGIVWFIGIFRSHIGLRGFMLTEILYSEGIIAVTYITILYSLIHYQWNHSDIISNIKGEQ